MDKVILIRFGEIFLKGRNRDQFEFLLIRNIKNALKSFKYTFTKSQGRYFVSDFEPDLEEEIVETILRVFGVYSVSVAVKVPTDLDKIKAAAVKAAEIATVGKPDTTFRVSVRRADKRVPYNSSQLGAMIGSDIYEQLHIPVSLTDYKLEIHVDIRENGWTYVYDRAIMAVGGLPVGCSGKGMLLLSGGIDSPVAAYMMLKRGLNLVAVHFSSPPYTSEAAKQKVIDLRNLLLRYCDNIKLLVVPFTDIQIQIHQKCPAEFMITIMRRIMMRIAERLSKKYERGCIITGESLGQVASQTMSSIDCTNSVVTMPVFRPLIGMDKCEIMDISRKIGTYDTSILPFEDCCTIFLPKNPATQPKRATVEKFESVLDLETLIEKAVENIEIF